MTTMTPSLQLTHNPVDPGFENADIGDLDDAITRRADEVCALAATATQRIAWAADIDGRYSGGIDQERSRRVLGRALANLNAAVTHLDDVLGS